MIEHKFEYILRNKLSGEIVKQVLTLDELQRGDCLLCGAGVVLYDVIAKRQSTGFRDMLNKNSVYDHDIINHIEYGFLKVEWDYSDTGWICLDKNFKKRRLVDVLLSGGIKVSNIYENPELYAKEK